MALVNWADAETFDVLRDKFNAMVAVVNNIVSVPIGGIQMYFGSPADSALWDSSGIGVDGTQYEKFALCLGQGLSGSTLVDFTGTAMGIAPDFRGKFPSGYDPTQAEFPIIGSTGGVKSVTLSANQSGLRQHSHTVSTAAAAFTAGSGLVETNGVVSRTTGAVKSVDGVSLRDNAQPALESHENLPPYLSTGFIIRYK